MAEEVFVQRHLFRDRNRNADIFDFADRRLEQLSQNGKILAVPASIPDAVVLALHDHSTSQPAAKAITKVISIGFYNKCRPSFMKGTHNALSG